jgi:hypothetical protein
MDLLTKPFKLKPLPPPKKICGFPFIVVDTMPPDEIWIVGEKQMIKIKIGGK